jgi:DNA-binding MarR family transcriptional regulator
MVNVVDQTEAVGEDAVVTDITRLLLEARRSLASELDADLGERGYPDLRPGHAALFLSVDRRSGSRLTDLADQTRLTKQAMMSMVDDLETRGYVRRVPDPADARAKLVRLTAHGRRASAECRRAVQALEQRTRRLLGDRSYDALREALELLSEPIDALEG